MSNPLSVDFWYRHEDDTERIQRAEPQMTMGAQSDDDIVREIASLRSQGYLIQRVVVQTLCTNVLCQGSGQIAVPPKGTRLKNIASLPAWRLVYRTCTDCDGNGYLSTRDYPIRKAVTTDNYICPVCQLDLNQTIQDALWTADVVRFECPMCFEPLISTRRSIAVDMDKNK